MSAGSYRPVGSEKEVLAIIRVTVKKQKCRAIGWGENKMMMVAGDPAEQKRAKQIERHRRM